MPGSAEPVWRLQQGSPEMSDIRPLTAGEGCLHRFKNGFGLKIVKVTGEKRPYSHTFYCICWYNYFIIISYCY